MATSSTDSEKYLWYSTAIKYFSSDSDDGAWWIQDKAFCLDVTGWKSFSVPTQHAESSVAVTQSGSMGPRIILQAPAMVQPRLQQSCKDISSKLPLPSSVLCHPQTGMTELKDCQPDSVMFTSPFKSSYWKLLQQGIAVASLNVDLIQFWALGLKRFHEAHSNAGRILNPLAQSQTVHFKKNPFKHKYSSLPFSLK